MRLLRPAMTALLLTACAPALVAPAFAQTCICPPAENLHSGPVIQAPEPPPPLVEYEQPSMPAPGYHWTPGYWAWNNADYYWVPGVWIEPPRVGVLWTPPYWGFVGGVYVFHAGYWAPHVGFYGGINYGFGYGGHGYEGGRWDNGQFYYNRAVNNFGATQITRVYNQPITVNNTTINRVSYNGGQGGLQVRPTPEQEQVAADPHIPATPSQVTHVRTASVNADQFQSTNQGKPPVAATPRPGELKAPGVVPARAAGAAQSVPAPGPNAPAEGKPEDKLLPGAKTPAGLPPLAPAQNALPTPKAELPAGVAKPVGAGQAPLTGQPPKSEPLNTPKVKLPVGAAKPLGVEKQPTGLPTTGAEKPLKTPAVEKTLKAEPLKASEKPAPHDLKMQEPQKPEKIPAGAMSGGPPKPPVVQKAMRPEPAAIGAPKGPPAGEHRPPQPGGKGEPACGRPGLPPCPR